MADLPLANRVRNAAAGSGGGGGKGSTAGAGKTAAGAARATGVGAVAGSAVSRVQRAPGAAATAARSSVVGKHPKNVPQIPTKKRIGAIIDTHRAHIRHGSSSVPPPAAAVRKAAPAVASSATPPTSAGVADDGSDSSVEIIETTSPKPAQPNSSSNKEVCAPAKTSDAKAKLPPQKDARKQESTREWTTVWTCDVCKTEQFDCYEDAVAHEKICLAKKKVSAAVKAAASASKKTSAPKPSPSPKNVAPIKPLTLFSPILKDSSDSTNFSQISKYHRLVLKSLKLLYLPPASSGGGSVSFQCQFSSHTYTPPSDGNSKKQYWTLKAIAEKLPSMVLSRVMYNQCKDMPHDIVMQMPSAKMLGKMLYSEFISGFFSENGIVERHGRGVVVLPDEDFRKMPGALKSKRGKELPGGSGKKKRGRPHGSTKVTAASKRQKAAEPARSKSPHVSTHKDIKFGNMGCKTHYEEGHQFCVGPLDGIPFLSSFSSQSGASKKLRPFEKFLLQQLELFTLFPKLVEAEKLNVPPQSVGMRCRNCIADKNNGCCFMKLSSVDNISRDLLLMATEHFRSCKFMKAKEVKLIQELKGAGYDSSSLTKYCNWMVKLYSLENSNAPGVVWGDSPKVPAGEYCSPADVKVSSLLVADTPMPDLEVESSSSAKEVEKKEFVAEGAAYSTMAAIAAPTSMEKSSLDVSTITQYHSLVLTEFVIVPSPYRMSCASDSNMRELQSPSEPPLMTASFKCKRDKKIIGIPISLEQMSTMLMELPSYLESCPLVTPAEKEELAAKYRGVITASKDPQSKEESNTTNMDKCVAYVKELCTKVYGMVDVRDPNTGAPYVGFSNIAELKTKYGKIHVDSSSIDEDSFYLSLIQKSF